jgi:hypothetical protein
MTDPFSSFEAKNGATRELLRILVARKYPTLISTKSATLSRPAYSDLLAAGSFLVRFSISVIRESERANIEKGSGTPNELFHTIESLSRSGVTCAVRLQPIIPGHERHVFALIRKAKDAGARHITLEYLKLPIDDLSSPICTLTNHQGEQLVDLYRRIGAVRQGRELVLPRESKVSFLSEASKFAREQGLTVGFGDNEFLPYSDGRSCCSGSDLYLNNANPFEANPASLVRKKKQFEQITFNELLSQWMPTLSVNTYLNSKVRSEPRNGESNWLSYLKQHWKMGAIYAPDFFYGVEFTGSYDDSGMAIFLRNRVDL